MKMTEEELMEKIGKTVEEKIKPLLTINTSARPDDKQKDKDEKSKFASFGEQLKAIANVEIKHEVDPRLIEVKAASGMNEGVGAEGGFLVDPEFTKGLLMEAYDTGKLAKDCWKVPMSRNSLTMKVIDETSRADGSRRGGIQVYWEAEAGEKIASKPKLRQVKLDLEKLIGLYYATDELLEDTVALESLMKKLFAEDFGFKIDDGIINGTGAGQLLGLLNGAGLVTQNKEAAQAAATVVAENIMKMWNRMSARNRIKAKWYINQDVEPQLMQMYVPAGLAGVPIWLPPGGLVTSPSGTLLGRPIEPIEQCSALGTAGDIVLADLSRYVLGQKAGGIKAASSIHVRFIYDESAFRFVLRLDGQPLVNSAVTAFKGGTTRSPYVALQTRA